MIHSSYHKFEWIKQYIVAQLDFGVESFIGLEYSWATLFMHCEIPTLSLFPGFDDGDVHEGVEVPDEAPEPSADVQVLSPGLGHHGPQLGVGQGALYKLRED